MIEFGHLLKEIRQRWDISVPNLARALGLSTLDVIDIERGRRRLSDERIVECPWTRARHAMIEFRIAEYRARIAWLEANRDPVEIDDESIGVRAKQ